MDKLDVLKKEFGGTITEIDNQRQYQLTDGKNLLLVSFVHECLKVIYRDKSGDEEMHLFKHFLSVEGFIKLKGFKGVI